MGEIDYPRMKRVAPLQRQALAQAKQSGSWDRVRAVCKLAVEEWDEIGCWPDDWAMWQVALNDAAPAVAFIDLAELRDWVMPSVRVWGGLTCEEWEPIQGVEA